MLSRTLPHLSQLKITSPQRWAGSTRSAPCTAPVTCVSFVCKRLALWGIFVVLLNGMQEVRGDAGADGSLEMNKMESSRNQAICPIGQVRHCCSWGCPLAPIAAVQGLFWSTCCSGGMSAGNHSLLYGQELGEGRPAARRERDKPCLSRGGGTHKHSIVLI